jgi:hypothetical protein
MVALNCIEGRPSTMATNTDTTMTTTVATGYQEPNIQIHFSNGETLRRISRNDPNVAGSSSE